MSRSRVFRWSAFSTNVRILWERLAFRVLLRVSPGRAEARAFELFGRTWRPRKLRPPEVPGMAGRRFSVALGRHTLAAYEYGDGPTVLLVHGWNGHAGQFAGLIGPLVQAGFRVVAFDQPGHGFSTGHWASVLDLRSAVEAVGRRAGPLHAIVGHSLGGTASGLALVAGLSAGRAVLIAPPAELPPFAAAFAARLGLPAQRVPGMLSHVRPRLGVDIEDVNLGRLAAGLRTPALILHDREDPEVPFAQGQIVAGAWRSAQLEALSGLGHRRPLRDADVIARVVAFVGHLSSEADRDPGAGWRRAAAASPSWQREGNSGDDTEPDRVGDAAVVVV